MKVPIYENLPECNKKGDKFPSKLETKRGGDLYMEAQPRAELRYFQNDLGSYDRPQPIAQERERHQNIQRVPEAYGQMPDQYDYGYNVENEREYLGSASYRAPRGYEDTLLRLARPPKQCGGHHATLARMYLRIPLRLTSGGLSTTLPYRLLILIQSPEEDQRAS